MLCSALAHIGARAKQALARRQRGANGEICAGQFLGPRQTPAGTSGAISRSDHPRRIDGLGLQQGWRCLEVGGGGGSVAAWLCERVGPAGSVVATDINTRLLEGIELPNFEARRHDITCDSLPDGEFDFVHIRWLLHHLPEPERAIRRMIGALRPGGWLLLEEVDFFPVYTSPSRVYVDFMVALVNTVVSASGRDCFWARVARTGCRHGSLAGRQRL
jgi:ubiquinone/menaquinone biosynthesis C-methylase UbiE